jgi:ribosomal 30S subunit maturation factor RimM
MLYKTMTAAALAVVLATPAFAQSSQADKPKTDAMRPQLQQQSDAPKAEKGMTTGQSSMDRGSGTMEKSQDQKASSPGSMEKNAATDSDKASMDKKATADRDKAGKSKASMAQAGEKKPGFVQKPEAGDWRASKLIGASVVGPDDKSIGDINELLIAEDGGVEAVVVGVGGFLGIGEKNVAIPFDSLNVRREANSDDIEKISVSFSKAELESAPKFAYSDEQPRPATTGANPGGTTPGAKPAARSENPPKQNK